MNRTPTACGASARTFVTPAVLSLGRQGLCQYTSAVPAKPRRIISVRPLLNFVVRPACPTADGLVLFPQEAPHQGIDVESRRGIGVAEILLRNVAAQCEPCRGMIVKDRHL